MARHCFAYRRRGCCRHRRYGCSRKKDKRDCWKHYRGKLSGIPIEQWLTQLRHINAKSANQKTLRPFIRFMVSPSRHWRETCDSEYKTAHRGGIIVSYGCCRFMKLWSSVDCTRVRMPNRHCSFARRTVDGGIKMGNANDRLSNIDRHSFLPPGVTISRHG